MNFSIHSLPFVHLRSEKTSVWIRGEAKLYRLLKRYYVLWPFFHTSAEIYEIPLTMNGVFRVSPGFHIIGEMKIGVNH